MKRFAAFFALALAAVLALGGCSTAGENIKEPESETETTVEITEAKKEYTDEELSKMIAFTFDDGPGASSTDRIIDTLEKYGCTATFFVIGSNINDSSAEKMKRAVSIGCEIGNHTQNHNTKLNSLPSDSINSELERTSDLIEKYIGVRPTLMRPPGGSFSKIQNNIDYAIIHWSVDTNDWRKKSNAGNTQAANNLADFIIDQVSGNGGSIVLMHDIYTFTAETVEIVIPRLTEMGYKICSVSELAEAYGLTLVPGKVYFSFDKVITLEPGTYTVATQSSPLTVRNEPSGTEVLSRLSKGSVVTVLECKDGWAKVKTDDTEGWVNAKYLSK